MRWARLRASESGPGASTSALGELPRRERQGIRLRRQSAGTVSGRKVEATGKGGFTDREIAGVVALTAVRVFVKYFITGLFSACLCLPRGNNYFR